MVKCMFIALICIGIMLNGYLVIENALLSKYISMNQIKLDTINARLNITKESKMLVEEIATIKAEELALLKKTLNSK